jgi:hypothetical protein
VSLNLSSMLPERLAVLDAMVERSRDLLDAASDKGARDARAGN